MKSAILILDSLVLGVVQGFTEFLPVSSSGHLVLAERLLGMARPGLALEVGLHAGTLVAVLAVYRKDLKAVRPWVPVLWATLPAAVAGLLLRHQVDALFGSLRLVGLGWALTAALLVWAARRDTGRRTVEDLTPWQALRIGCFQALALAPGVSRSGAVLSAALAQGLAPAEAARFAFLLSVPAVLGAAVVELPGGLVAGLEVTGVWLGASVAAVSGVLAIRWLLGRLESRRLGSFAVYCAGLALVVLAIGG